MTCDAPKLGGRRRRHTKKHRRSRRRHTRRGGGYGAVGAEQTAAGPFMAYGGINASGAELRSTAGEYGAVTGGRRRSRRSRRSRRRMRGGDAGTDTGGDGRGGLSAGFQGEGVAGIANHSAVTTR
jgi:hypothetical protein